MSRSCWVYGFNLATVFLPGRTAPLTQSINLICIGIAKFLLTFVLVGFLYTPFKNAGCRVICPVILLWSSFWVCVSFYTSFWIRHVTLLCYRNWQQCLVLPWSRLFLPPLTQESLPLRRGQYHHVAVSPQVYTFWRSRIITSSW